MDYKKHIGDGKLPNKYWVFQYDEKFTRDADGELHSTNDDSTVSGLIGEYKTYQEAITHVDIEAFLPHVTIEDRISGQVFESLIVKCRHCGHEEYETRNDIGYTKKFIEDRGLIFK